MREFVKQIIIQLDIGENTTRVGLISFSNKATVDVNLKDMNNKVELVPAVEGLTFEASVTNTHKAIDKAWKMFKTQ